MVDGSDVLTRVCAALDDDRRTDAASIITNEYSFTRVESVGRRYSEIQAMRIFRRDGFIDCYSGTKLIFPGTLRLMSYLFPAEFPFHKNWKTDACHFAFYDLFPTIDHLVPVSRGGADREENWVTTSMVRNTAKANFTIEELGWNLKPVTQRKTWDGLTGWFQRYVAGHSGVLKSDYLRRWFDAANRTADCD